MLALDAQARRHAVGHAGHPSDWGQRNTQNSTDKHANQERRAALRATSAAALRESGNCGTSCQQPAQNHRVEFLEAAGHDLGSSRPVSFGSVAGPAAHSGGDPGVPGQR